MTILNYGILIVTILTSRAIVKLFKVTVWETKQPNDFILKLYKIFFPLAIILSSGIAFLAFEGKELAMAIPAAITTILLIISGVQIHKEIDQNKEKMGTPLSIQDR